MSVKREKGLHRFSVLEGGRERERSENSSEAVVKKSIKKKI